MTEPFRRIWLIAMAVMPMLGPLPTAAQETDEIALIHWAYAATFGSGVYELGESTEALVVRAPFALPLRAAEAGEGCNCGLKLLLPVTLGVQDFDIDALLAGDFPRRVEQVSFLPGVEIELPRNDRWTLRVRAQVGWGTELGGDQDSAWIYAAGIRSRLMWPERKLQPAWIIGLQSTGYDAEHAERQSLARLTNGIELDIGVPRWEFREEPMRLMPYVLNDQYVHSVHVFSVVDEAIDELDAEWEIGVAAGRDRPFSIFGIEFDRVGFGFRFSEESRGIRILFGSIF